MAKKNEQSKTKGVSLCMSFIGSKWKPIIIFKISNGINRFNNLFHEIEGINRQMLSKQLKELEKSEILERTVFPEIPPRVEYKLTPLGKSFLPLIQMMNRWGIKFQEAKVKPKEIYPQQLPLF